MHMRKGILVLGLAVLTVVGLGCDQDREEIALRKEIISTGAAPKAIGPYSQAVKIGPWFFASGQIAIDPATGQVVGGNFEREARQVLENLGAVLKAAGMGYKDVVQVTVFLSDLSLYNEFNRIYAEYFKRDFPARCAVEVARLPKEVHVEIAAIAYQSSD